MRQVVLLRNVLENVQSLGNLFVFDENGKTLFSSKSLERAWLNNTPNVSCVLAGVYDLIYEYSDSFEEHLWELKGVPNRSECKFHVANFWKQLEGCIAPGDMHIDINRDGARDVRNSRKTLKRFHKAMHPFKEARIHIININ